MNRRRFLASVGSTTTIIATAGCISVNTSGTMDVVVNNCLDSNQTDENANKRADVQIEYDESGNVIFDETMTVPEMSCSDVVDGVEREDVFSEAGSYTVVAAVDGYDRAETQVEFSTRQIEDNADSVVITIREETIEIQ